MEVLHICMQDCSEGHDWKIDKNISFEKWCSTELYCDPMLFNIIIRTLDDRRVNILTKSSGSTKLGEAASVWEDRIQN